MKLYKRVNILGHKVPIYWGNTDHPTNNLGMSMCESDMKIILSPVLKAKNKAKLKHHVVMHEIIHMFHWLTGKKYSQKMEEEADMIALLMLGLGVKI